MYYQNGFVMKYEPGGAVAAYCDHAFHEKDRKSDQQDRELIEFVNTRTEAARMKNAQERREMAYKAIRRKKRFENRRILKWDRVVSAVALMGLMMALYGAQVAGTVHVTLVIPIGMLCAGYVSWAIGDICRIVKAENREVGR